jgi:hypothetical protein
VTCDLVAQAIHATRELGFPILAAGFLLWKVAPAIRRNTEAINDLRAQLATRQP